MSSTGSSTLGMPYIVQQELEDFTIQHFMTHDSFYWKEALSCGNKYIVRGAWHHIYINEHHLVVEIQIKPKALSSY